MDIFFFFQGPVTVKDDKGETLESVLESNRNKRHYFGDGENDYVTGACTYNVGMAKAVLKMIEKSKFDRIIYAYDDFKDHEKVNAAVAEGLKDCHCGDIIPIHFKKNDDSDTILSAICQKSKNSFKEGNKVYIASNSGIRSNMMFFSTFLQILDCRKVTTRLYYDAMNEVVDNQGNKFDKVKDITDTNKYYEILRGVELFTETGNPTKLIEFYKDYNNIDLDRLFLHMEKFYNSIQVCRRVKEKGLLDTYIQLIEQIDYIFDKYVNIDENQEKALIKNNEKIPDIFKLLIPCIKSSFSKKKKSGKELIQIIQWCIDNNNITLGYFIFNVELVNYLMEKNVLKNKLPDRNELKKICQLKENEYLDNNQDYQKMEILVRYCTSSLKCNNNNLDPKYECNIINEKIMKNFGFESSDYVKLKKILSICTITRKVRNSIAHSDDYDVLYNDEVLIDIISSYEKMDNEKIFTSQNNNSDIGKTNAGYKLEADDDSYFNIIKKLLKYMLNDIKELV